MLGLYRYVLVIEHNLNRLEIAHLRAVNNHDTLLNQVFGATCLLHSLQDQWCEIFWWNKYMGRASINNCEWFTSHVIGGVIIVGVKFGSLPYITPEEVFEHVKLYHGIFATSDFRIIWCTEINVRPLPIKSIQSK